MAWCNPLILRAKRDARSLSRRTSVKHNSEAAHEIEASAASGKRPSEAAARPIFVTANFVTRLLFVTAPNASRAASKAAGDASAASGKRPSEAAARPIFVTANFVTRLL